MRSRWARGDVVALRMFRRGRVFWVAPVRVVEDSMEVTALFLAADTATRTAIATSHQSEDPAGSLVDTRAGSGASVVVGVIAPLPPFPGGAVPIG